MHFSGLLQFGQSYYSLMQQLSLTSEERPSNRPNGVQGEVPDMSPSRDDSM